MSQRRNLKVIHKFQPDETLQSIRKIRRKIYETRNFWQNGMDEAFK